MTLRISFIMAIMGVLPTLGNAKRLESFWVKGTCDENMCYKIHFNRKTWSKAADTCVREGMELLSQPHLSSLSDIVRHLVENKLCSSCKPFLSWTNSSQVNGNGSICTLLMDEQGTLETLDLNCIDRHKFVCQYERHCPEHWNEPINNSCYFLSDEKTHFLGALRGCEERNSTLVSASNPHLLTYLTDYPIWINEDNILNRTGNCSIFHGGTNTLKECNSSQKYICTADADAVKAMIHNKKKTNERLHYGEMKNGQLILIASVSAGALFALICLAILFGIRKRKQNNLTRNITRTSQKKIDNETDAENSQHNNNDDAIKSGSMKNNRVAIVAPYMISSPECSTILNYKHMDKVADIMSTVVKNPIQYNGMVDQPIIDLNQTSSMNSMPPNVLKIPPPLPVKPKHLQKADIHIIRQSD